MLIERKDLMDLLGLLPETGPGSQQRYVMPGSRRGALFAWEESGAVTIEVSERVDGEDSDPVVSLSGSYFPEDDAFEIDAIDRTGEASEPADPRAVATLWRRLVRFMEPTA